MIFDYKGRITASNKKKKGKIEADSRREALAILKGEGIAVLSLNELTAASKDINLRRKVKNADFVMFLRQYSTLINAGVTISEATKTMSEQVTSKMLKTALVDVNKQVERGESLSVAASRHEKVFPSLLINMIYAGETSGRLDDMLESMADYYEKQYNAKRKMISSLMYPGAVGVVAVLLTVFLLAYIVPTFAEMFTSMGEDIPAYTKFVLALSDFIVDYWYIVIMGVLLIIATIFFMSRFEAVMKRWDKVVLKIPLVGNLIHKNILVRTVQTLGMLLDASMPILQALEITERVVSNRTMKKAVNEMGEVLTSGGEMSGVMARHKIFPPLLTQMVQIGERTGGLDHMLGKGADFYEEEVSQLTDRFGSLVEPILIVGLAVIVGGIVMAVIIPMFSLYEAY